MTTVNEYEELVSTLKQGKGFCPFKRQIDLVFFTAPISIQVRTVSSTLAM
jgi:hypothetical protein